MVYIYLYTLPLQPAVSYPSPTIQAVIEPQLHSTHSPLKSKRITVTLNLTRERIKTILRLTITQVSVV